ncbi:hypothetical protein AB0J51_02245 [Micromonospora echinofusca]|uniref:hypothetical protein n=1 Tax=Micromonospora echinofusca TaxID=47858 RepID=UPI003421F950
MRIIDQVRAEALRRDIPAADVERWLDLARPSALLTPGGDGPVVGAIRGPVMLPADVAVEEREQYPPDFPPDDKEHTEVYEEIPQGDLHLTVDISLPYVKTIPGPLPVLLGGYGTYCNGCNPAGLGAKTSGWSCQTRAGARWRAPRRLWPGRSVASFRTARWITQWMLAPLGLPPWNSASRTQSPSCLLESVRPDEHGRNGLGRRRVLPDERYL